LKEVARQVGVQDKGSKEDIVSRLKGKLKDSSIFKKVFTKVWGSSGEISQTYLVLVKTSDECRSSCYRHET
jgi:hypothetical protein